MRLCPHCGYFGFLDPIDPDGVKSDGYRCRTCGGDVSLMVKWLMDERVAAANQELPRRPV